MHRANLDPAQSPSETVSRKDPEMVRKRKKKKPRGIIVARIVLFFFFFSFSFFFSRAESFIFAPTLETQAF
jgi:hypothetical protein